MRVAIDATPLTLSSGEKVVYSIKYYQYAIVEVQLEALQLAQTQLDQDRQRLQIGTLAVLSVQQVPGSRVARQGPAPRNQVAPRACHSLPRPCRGGHTRTDCLDGNLRVGPDR